MHVILRKRHEVLALLVLCDVIDVTKIDRIIGRRHRVVSVEILLSKLSVFAEVLDSILGSKYAPLCEWVQECDMSLHLTVWWLQHGVESLPFSLLRVYLTDKTIQAGICCKGSYTYADHMQFFNILVSRQLLAYLLTDTETIIGRSKQIASP